MSRSRLALMLLRGASRPSIGRGLCSGLICSSDAPTQVVPIAIPSPSVVLVVNGGHIGIQRIVFFLVGVHSGTQRYPPLKTFDIFEGTEQIQQLLVSRAISGMRIE